MFFIVVCLGSWSRVSVLSNKQWKNLRISSTWSWLPLNWQPFSKKFLTNQRFNPKYLNWQRLFLKIVEIFRKISCFWSSVLSNAGMSICRKSVSFARTLSNLSLKFLLICKIFWKWIKVCSKVSHRISRVKN